MTDQLGTAKPSIQGSSIAPLVDGRILRETLASLEAGGMSPKSLLAVKEQATRLVGRILSAYDARVAAGEVGPDGSARASLAEPRSGRAPTGLLYGRVQSGKTLAMIATTAMALDNGFRVVVVLTSDNVSLVQQTASRFAVLPGVNVKDSSQLGSWVEDQDHLRTAISESGLILITAKNTSHLTTFIEFLQGVGAADYPALILDDEADQATLDTTTSAKSKALAKGAAFAKPASSIHRKTNYNDAPAEEGNSIRSVLRHHLYLQVTATPYALLLQSTTSPLRPVFSEILEPGAGYTGSHFFFRKEILDQRSHPLVFVAPDEADRLALDKPLPDGLAEAVSYFLVAAAAQGLTDVKYRFGSQNFLCHTSMRKDDHRLAADVIKQYLRSLYEALRDPGKQATVDVALERGLRELVKTVKAPPSVEEIRQYVRGRLVDRELKIVNSEQDDANFGPKLNFIVGGNILGRGLTIENLLVTYYMRSAKIAQMDTVLQHARMFGYRMPAETYLRVYIPELQALRFFRIHEADLMLRALLEQQTSTKIPVQVAKDLRATRTNVLDATHVCAYLPGQHIYPSRPFYGARAEQVHQQAVARIKLLLPNGEFRRAGTRRAHGESVETELVPIPIDTIVEAVSYLPFHKLPGDTWDPAAITNVLRSSRDFFPQGGFLYARTAKRGAMTEGMLSDVELRTFKSASGPVLAVFLDDSGALQFPKENVHITFPYLFPELVFPNRNGLPAHVFNDTE